VQPVTMRVRMIKETGMKNSVTVPALYRRAGLYMAHASQHCWGTTAAPGSLSKHQGRTGRDDNMYISRALATLQ
jgi:hypothetical protein